MEEIKLKVSVEVTIIDDTYNFNILSQEGVTIRDIRSILCGGIALLIRSEDTPKLQGEALRNVINILESEFINVDSFSDIKKWK